MELSFFAGCATPQEIKKTSREQGAVLNEFQNSIGSLRTKLLEYYDQQIEEFQLHLLEAKLRRESSRVTMAFRNAMQETDPNMSQEDKENLIRTYLNESSNYIVQLPKIYFDENYCEHLKHLQPQFLKTQAEECDDQHITIYKKLRDARNQVGKRFNQLAKTVVDMQQAHMLIDRFVQIEFKLTKERVDVAKKLIREAKETVEDAKKVLENPESPVS